MKKLIVITLLMAPAFFANTQSLVQENKIWNVVECVSWGPCQTQSFILAGDTTVLQKDYKKLYATYDPELLNPELIGGMREVDDKVFLYHFNSNAEEILYDFNLLPGDIFTTINHAIGGCLVELQLASIDTVILANGETRQQFNFSNQEQWIAGIGSLNGLVYVGFHLCWIDLYNDLSCCHLDDEMIYKSPNYVDCINIAVGIGEKEVSAKHVVYPNPFTRYLILEFDYTPLHTYRLQIINSKGQIVTDEVDINSGKVMINANHLSAGPYFYRLFNEAGVLADGKLIRED